MNPKETPIDVPPTVADNGDPQFVLAPEDYPNVDHLITEDNRPLDNIYVERQQRLLTEPLYSSWQPAEGASFVALANVGLFYSLRQPALVPDCLLSLEVRLPADLWDKNHRSYFTWEFEKVPDVVLEIVSDRRGGEATYKLREYARIRVPYYVIYDPHNLLDGGRLRVLELQRRHYSPVADNWLADVGLGLTFWRGQFEGAEEEWLRWCDHEGHVILTGRERAEQERQRAEQERQRAEQERQRAEQAEQRAQQSEQLAQRLEAQLRALGHEPES